LQVEGKAEAENVAVGNAQVGHLTVSNAPLDPPEKVEKPKS
jgi:hypothetical protein